MGDLPLPPEWTTLPGDWTMDTGTHHGGARYLSDMTAIRVTQRIRPGLEIAAYVPLTNELVDDPGIDIDQIMLSTMDRHFRPWLYPDRYRWPMFDPFPRWTRTLGWLRRHTPRLHRAD